HHPQDQGQVLPRPSSSPTSHTRESPRIGRRPPAQLGALMRSAELHIRLSWQSLRAHLLAAKVVNFLTAINTVKRTSRTNFAPPVYASMCVTKKSPFSHNSSSLSPSLVRATAASSRGAVQ